MTHLSAVTLPMAKGNRHGVVFEPQQLELSQSDVRSISHIGVPQSVAAPWQSAAGGVARRRHEAELAAMAEAVERLAAMTVTLPTRTSATIATAPHIPPEEWSLFSEEQRRESTFPFNGIYRDAPYTNVFSVHDNKEIFVPHPLVVLQDEYQTGVPTSSGLAAGPTPIRALLRAIQELIERDALMTTWLHGLPGRVIASLPHHSGEVNELGGEVYTMDITPAYSLFPVIAVIGGIQKNGTWRYSLGVACRESWQDAAEKAYLEWNQGVVFAGIYGSYVDVSSLKDPFTLRSFDEHAIFYTANPEYWNSLAIFRDTSTIHQPPKNHIFTSDRIAVRKIARACERAGIRLYYRDITTIDAAQLGLSVVRALSPDMAQIFAHQEWPFLHKVKDYVENRYPDLVAYSQFPYNMPHPLG